jgi:phosphoglycerol transferase MdoB-like AlkP superfamily enzyme
VLYAVYQMIGETREIQAYSHLPDEEVLRRVRGGMQLPPAAFRDPLCPMTHALIPTGTVGKKPNLVILLQESLGARYVASLGGLPVAEKIETWRSRSLWFDQLYATGTRSARGIEAITAGFLPTRTSSVIKLEGAQHEFFTLAKTLKSQGYRTEFIYGGDSSFDNMRRFFLGNGFDRVLDWSDISPTAHFMTTWGVSDEDLYARVHQEVSRHGQDGQPFFTLVFSTSNHPPYDFPDGRISLYEEPKMTANNAARYADFAVGSYLETAAQSAYWANSLFMVVADHESRVSGDGIVPVFSFHIPAFIAGGPVVPRVVTRLASQIDLLPTALSMMGVAAEIPATGIDQTRADLVGPGRAIMQFHDTAAYRVGDEVVMLAPGQAPSQFRVSGQTLLSTALNTELVRDAQGITQYPVLAYQRGWYR